MVTREKVMTLDGRDVFVFTLKNAQGSYITVTNYGAIIMEICVPDRNKDLHDINLGFDTVDGYLQDHPFFGATVGRYANRIANGRFVLNGVTYALACNENKISHLHGGNVGFDKKVWSAQTADDKLLLSYVSPDGEEGYPGELSVTVCFAWSDDNALSISYEAKTTRDTILNLTNHAYFNLNGAKEDILGHELLLNASFFTPVDEHLIPTGELMPTQGTPFDFSKPHKIGERIGSDHPQMVIGQGYDHNFVIEGDGMRFFARLYDQDSGRVMEVYSDQPAMQVYTANFMGDMMGKKPYHRRYGVCFETQNYPDAVNHPNFPSCVLKPGEVYRTSTVYRFSAE